MIDGVARHESGQVALSGALLVLQRRIDSMFVDWARRRGAEEYQFPTFIPASELKKADYLRSFPHLVTFAAALDPSEANLQRFARGDLVNGDGEVQATSLTPLKHVLTPAACYHFYIHFQGTNLEAPRYLTTCATCFRRESSYQPLERQWSFSMRELVCIGSEAEVSAFLAEMRIEIDRFVAEIALPVEWKDATDAFFQPGQNPKAWLQRLEPNKLELVFGGGLAIASINYHRNYFGETFRLTRDGRSAFSGCVAFGLERWLSAIVRHFGAEPESWPTAWHR